MSELSPAQRSELRASAHNLNPVVSIAGNGLTPSVLQEIERSLQAHELIKIKVHGAEREQREQLLAAVCAELDAAPVQHIGTILVVWRKRREDEAEAVSQKAAKLADDKRPSKGKSASSFSATARRAAALQDAAAKKRYTKRPLGRGPVKKPTTSRGRG